MDKTGTSGGKSARLPGKDQKTSRRPQIVICSKSELKGSLSFGDGCVIHPGCVISAEGGDIVFGEFNIIEERVRIVNRLKKDEKGNPIKRTMRIGSYNTFEVGSYIDSSDIGDMNEF